MLKTISFFSMVINLKKVGVICTNPKVKINLKIPTLKS
ncbi:MAG: Hypothetical protein AJITA_00943 [Acetilactobacillus jinshanensis]